MIGTRTATLAASTRTARTTRSRKTKPTEVEEKNEDNNDIGGAEPAASLEPPRAVEGSNTTTSGKAGEPGSDAATESYEDASDEMPIPTEAEMRTMERTVKRLRAAVAKADLGRGTTPSDRMKQLAVDLQRLTTSLVKPVVEAPDPLLEKKAPPSRERENYEEAEALDLSDDSNGERSSGQSQADGTIGRRAMLRTERRPPRRVHSRASRQPAADNEDANHRPRRRGRSHGSLRRQEHRDRDEVDHRRRHEHRWREQRPRPRRELPNPNPSDGDPSSSDGSSQSDRWNRREDSSSSSESSIIEGSDSSIEGRAARRQARGSPRHERRYGRLDRRGGREHRARRGRRDREDPVRRPRTRNIKDLELPSFTPTPRASVSTWVDRIDLALRGAKESGRGEWSDRSLYFILGNKLMESAARWWVNMDRRLHRRDRTWTKLKVALLRRYGPRVDKSAAEARVNARFRLKNEPYADFAAGLREAADRNEVSERVFLAQFYRCLDRTVRQLVKQPPVPLTLEEAVEKAVEIDDPMDYVIGSHQVNTGPQLQQSGDGSRMVVIPGVGTLALQEGGKENVIEGSTTPTERPDALAICTNRQGVYNWPAGVYEIPPGQKWNGRFWAPLGNTGKKRKEKKKAATKVKSEPAAKPKKAAKRVAPESSSEDEVKEQPMKRHKTATTKTTAATKMVASDESPYGTTRVVEVRRSVYGGRRQDDAPTRRCLHCGRHDHWTTQCPNDPKCYACHRIGHFARDCTDPEGRKRNDEYKQKKAEETRKSAENEARA